jgi:signal transduction histidine kinase
LTLAALDGSLVLTIWDDGPGFDVAEALAAHPALDSGIGLRSIRSLAADSGAQFDIRSGPGGTSLVLSAPAFPAWTRIPEPVRES